MEYTVLIVQYNEVFWSWEHYSILPVPGLSCLQLANGNGETTHTLTAHNHTVQSVTGHLAVSKNGTVTAAQPKR